MLRSLPAGARPCAGLVTQAGPRAPKANPYPFHPERIHCPVLVVGGEEDKVVPITLLREMALWLGGDFKEYPNHGHWSWMQVEER